MKQMHKYNSLYRVCRNLLRLLKWVWPKRWVEHNKMIEGMKTHHTQDLPTIQAHTLHFLVYLKLQNPKDQLHTLYSSQPNMESILQSVPHFHLSHDKHAFNCQLPNYALNTEKTVVLKTPSQNCWWFQQPLYTVILENTMRIITKAMNQNEWLATGCHNIVDFISSVTIHQNIPLWEDIPEQIFLVLNHIRHLGTQTRIDRN